MKRSKKNLVASPTFNQLSSSAGKDLSRQIKILELDIPIQECKIVVPDNRYSFTFRYTGPCPMSTCQYHTEVTKNKCLLLDIKIPSGSFTDREIYYFKIEQNKTIPLDQKLQLRTINLMRKKSQVSIKANIIYYYFLSWIRENKEPEDTHFVYKKGSKKFLESIITKYPFVQEGVEFFEYWMLPFLFDISLYEEFCKTNQTMQIDSSDINLQSVLSLTPVKYSKIHLLITELADPKTQELLANSIF
jgi:hypothetical protein